MIFFRMGVQQKQKFHYMVANKVFRQPFYFVSIIFFWVIGIGFVFGFEEKGYLYLSPIPDAEYIPAETSVLIRFVSLSPFELTNLETFIQVSGENSGNHGGETRIAKDGRTIIFKPWQPFQEEELVTVHLSPGTEDTDTNSVESIHYQFTIGKSIDYYEQAKRRIYRRSQEEITAYHEKYTRSISGRDNESKLFKKRFSEEYDQAQIMNNGISVPSDFPDIKVPININPADGHIFINFRGDYSLVLDNTGTSEWYLHRRGEWGENDFKVQENGNLTLWKGGQFVGLNQNYQEVATYHTVDGYWTDDHELHVLENGGYVMLGVRGQYIDISRYIPGGPTNEYVYETVVQEFTSSGELIFQWRAWDHFDPRYISGPDNSGNSPFWGWDLTHMNAIDIDEDGHILVCSRHAHEITKIDRNSGKIIWRLGGMRSDFEFVNDSFNGFRGQHDIHSLGNNRYLLYDNGNQRATLASRAVEYELNLDEMTATLVWEFRDAPDFYAGYMGSAQRLSNGNTLICGVLQDLPKAMEVDANGIKQFVLDFVDYTHTYRVYRYPWEGKARIPYLITESHHDHLTLIFNQFGDQNVDYYKIYAGQSPQPTTVIDTSWTTLKRINSLMNGWYYFRVTSVDYAGNESDFSNEEETYVDIIDPTKPAENIIVNGDFSRDKTEWTWQVNSVASAVWDIEESVSIFTIEDGGSDFTDIKLFQTGIKLFQGEEYNLEFDAAAFENRIIQVRVMDTEVPFTDI